MAAHLMEAAAGDVEFKDGSFPSSAPTARWRSPTSPRRSIGRRACRRNSASDSRPRLVRQRAAELSRTAATSARWRSIPKPARSRVVRYAAVDDVGRVINPMICEGQIHGGVAQGIGQALMENVVYDARVRPARHRQLPGLRACRAPTICRDDRARSLHEVPVKTNPLGVKGVGRSRRDRRAAGGDRTPCSTRCGRSAWSISTCRSRRRASGRR